MQGGQLRVYTGNYSRYVEQVRSERADPVVARPARGPDSRRGEQERRQAEKLDHRREARRNELEEEIQRLEAALSQLTHELEMASRAQRVDRVYDLGREYERVQGQLQRYLEEWVGVAQK